MSTAYNVKQENYGLGGGLISFLSGLKFVNGLSFGQRETGNLVIKGENLKILKKLSKNCPDTFRCIYIDPPYNNQENYNHYSDALDHEIWIRQLTARIKCLYKLLTDDGSLWISIDDSEVHYLKVAIDRIFGRENFVTTIVWQQRTTRENRNVFSNNHEYILVYAKDAISFKKSRNLMGYTGEVLKRYKNPDKDPRGPWQSVSLNVQAGHAVKSQFYEIVSPNGKRHSPPKGRCWIYNESRMKLEIQNNNIWFGKDGNGVPRVKRFLRDSKGGLTPDTLWLGTDVGTNDSAKKHLLKLFPDHPVFDTPKPEGLIERILHIATNPGDYVLDAYLGSGTTCAVAHKTGRNYVGIEEGEHAITHCADRLKQVIEGESGGISELVNWSGGGGFDFYKS